MRNFPESPGTPSRRHIYMIVALLAALVLTVFLLMRRHAAQTFEEMPVVDVPKPQVMQPDPDFTGLLVCFINTGHGDCLFFRGPDGKTLLIDAGPADSFDAIKQQLDIWEVTQLDLLIATNLHTEHIGGMADILSHYKVEAFYSPPYMLNSRAYTDLLNILGKKNVTSSSLYAAANALIPWSDGCELRVLSPFDAPYANDSDTSFILRVKFGDTTVLCTSDASEIAERVMIKAFRNYYLHADILKVGGHGALGSTGDKLLNAVKPSVAVICVGQNNDYGLPDEAVLTRLATRNIPVYRTDLDGTFCFALDGTEVWMIK